MTASNVKSILLEHYSFENILELNLLKGGVSNKNYVFNGDNKKYVVRVCLFELKNQIESTIPFLKHAEKTDYPAPRLIKTRNGRDFVDNNGTPVIVTTYLEGVSASNISIDVKHLKSIAQLLAKFHKMNWNSPNTPLTLNPDYIFNLYEKVKDYTPTGKDKDSLHLIELVDKYYKKFTEANFTEFAEKLPQGVTHGDINLGNVLFEGDEAVSLIDFEELGTSWQLQDIAMVLIIWTFQDGKPNSEYIESFLKEYQLHRPLSEIERKNIVKAMEFIAFRQCVYAKSMMSKGTMESAKDFSAYWALLYIHENELSVNS